VSYVISRLLSQTSLKNDVPLPNSLEELRTREVNIDEYAKDDEWVKKASRFGKKILMVQPSKKNPRKVIKACSVVELFTKITGLLPNEVFDYIQVKNALAVRDNVHFSYPLDYENRDLPVFFHHNQFVFAVKKTGQVTLYFFFANNNNGLVFYDLVRYFMLKKYKMLMLSVLVKVKTKYCLKSLVQVTTMLNVVKKGCHFLFVRLVATMKQSILVII